MKGWLMPALGLLCWVLGAVGLATGGIQPKEKYRRPDPAWAKEYFRDNHQANPATVKPSPAVEYPRGLSFVPVVRGALPKIPTCVPVTYKPRPVLVGENGSYYGQISSLTGRPKTVAVRGYFRKNGTYVRSHFRSPPRRHYGRIRKR